MITLIGDQEKGILSSRLLKDLGFFLPLDPRISVRLFLWGEIADLGNVARLVLLCWESW